MYARGNHDRTKASVDAFNGDGPPADLCTPPGVVTVGDDEERRAISTNLQDHSSGGLVEQLDGPRPRAQVEEPAFPVELLHVQFPRQPEPAEPVGEAGPRPPFRVVEQVARRQSHDRVPRHRVDQAGVKPRQARRQHPALVRDHAGQRAFPEEAYEGAVAQGIGVCGGDRESAVGGRRRNSTPCCGSRLYEADQMGLRGVKVDEHHADQEGMLPLTGSASEPPGPRRGSQARQRQETGQAKRPKERRPDEVEVAALGHATHGQRGGAAGQQAHKQEGGPRHRPPTEASRLSTASRPDAARSGAKKQRRAPTRAGQ